MRKNLTLLAIGLALGASAQVHCDVLAPASLFGAYEHTWADPEPDAWGTPDMELVESRVVGDLVLAVDSDPVQDSLVCGDIANAGEVAGNIALIYRGDCTFVSKALNCQAAGAAGILIINNVPGDPPFGMGGSAPGVDVTIPLFMVSFEDGALLRAAIDNGETVTVLLGNKNGYYANDIGFTKSEVLRPTQAVTPTWLAAEPGDFVMPVGAFVRNFGTAESPVATLNGIITHNGDTLYNESAEVPVIIGEDTSAFVGLPDFTQDALDGRYELTYRVTTDPELSPGDNTYVLPFDFTDLFGMVELDPADGLPVSPFGIHPATSEGEFETCTVLRNQNASRVALTGIHFLGSKNEGTMEGELIISKVHLWSDVFTGLSDQAFAITQLQLLHTQEHNLADTGRFVQSYLPFAEAVLLDNDQRYLVCITATNPEVFFGANESVDYNANYEVTDQPIQANRNGSNWFLEFAGGQTTSHAATVIEVESIGIEERSVVELAPYPNPTSGIFMVPLAGHGATTITLMDAAGREVATHNTSSELYTLDLTGHAPGLYLISIQSGKGRGVGRLILE